MFQKKYYEPLTYKLCSNYYLCTLCLENFKNAKVYQNCCQTYTYYVQKSLAVSYIVIVSQPFPVGRNMNVNYHPLVLVGIWLCFSANYDWSTDTCMQSDFRSCVQLGLVSRWFGLVPVAIRDHVRILFFNMHLVLLNLIC